MPNLPAICQTCGAIFPSGFVISNSTNVTMQGNTAGPCPVCGGTGELPDGVFDFVGDTVRVLSSPKYSEDSINRMITTLRDLQSRHASADEVVQSLKQEVPELASWFDRFIRPKSPEAVAAWIAVIIALFQLIQGCQQPTAEDIERITEQAVQEVCVPQQPPPRTAP